MSALTDNEPIFRVHIAWHNPGRECKGIGALVQRELQSNSEMAYDAIYVAVPHKAWLSAIRAELISRHITPVPAKQAIAGVPSSDLEIDFCGAVTVGSYGQIAAVKPNHVFCLGLVEGLYPVGTESEEILQAERDVLRAIVEQTPGSIVFSSFKRCAPARAQEYHLSGRTRREHDETVVVISPSRFIAEMDDAAPSVVSGEQFMANYFG